jgi:hypothetical protein
VTDKDATPNYFEDITGYLGEGRSVPNVIPTYAMDTDWTQVAARIDERIIDSLSLAVFHAQDRDLNNTIGTARKETSGLQIEDGQRLSCYVAGLHHHSALRS